VRDAWAWWRGSHPKVPDGLIFFQNPKSKIQNQQSTINNQQSTINNHKSNQITKALLTNE
jgi:hypothetical protein